MGKIKIQKPTGNVEALNLVSAFTVEGSTYVILDSEKTGSMGLPIIYVSKLNDAKLEKINDDSEWEKAKSYLKGIISGTNFQYIKVSDVIDADEAYFRPLTLPEASFDTIRNRYVVKDETTTDEGTNNATLVLDNNVEAANIPNINNAPINEEAIPSAPAISVVPTPVEQAPVVPDLSVMPSVAPVEDINVTSAVTPVSPESEATPSIPEVTPPSLEPLIPSNNAASNNEISSAPFTPVVPTTPKVEVVPSPDANFKTSPLEVTNAVSTNVTNNTSNNDKETFLKACENMYDAIISKYEHKLAELEKREEILKQKEQEIDLKLQNASEHLANAEARETVANIAHDNAKKVMDLASMMPINPEATETGVI